MTQIAHADDLRAAAAKVSDCRAIEDDNARLTCLDAASLALSLALDSPSGIVDSQVETATPPRVAKVDAPKEPEWAKAPEPRVKPKKQAAAVATAPAQESEADKEEKVPIWARVFRGGDEEEENVYAVTVTRITRNTAGRHFFHTSEGQVWRQTVSGKVRPPKSLPVDATIQQKLIGAPGLRFVDGPSGEYTVIRIE